MTTTTPATKTAPTTTAAHSSDAAHAPANTALPADTDNSKSKGEKRSVPLSTVLLFLAGCVIMVLAAANITNLSEWAERWGQILVFLTFFIVMAIGGRWFFGGIDAFLTAARNKDEDA